MLTNVILFAPVLGSGFLFFLVCCTRYHVDINLIGRRRFVSENTSGLQKENAESQAKIRELEASLAGALARAATSDTR
jgi:hypothetical protein